MKRILLCVALAAFGIACGGSGMGKGVRGDITARMQSSEKPIAGCYADALKRNRDLQGRMVLEFAAAPGSGEFKGIRVVRNDLADKEFEGCVVKIVGGLKLEKPQKTSVAIEYPLDFTPTE